MSTTIANHDLLVRAATALGPIIADAMFVGGSIVGILAVDAAIPPRPTDDVDVALEVATTIEYQTRISDALRALGFEVDTRPRAPMCRWLKDGLVVDVMPIDENVLGFKNKWYRAAFGAREPYRLTDTLTIGVISAPFFLATKLEAFLDRGKGDYLASADIEDIVTVVDGRPMLPTEARSIADEATRKYLAAEFTRLLADRDFVDALPAHLGYQSASRERLQRLTSRLGELANIGDEEVPVQALPLVVPTNVDVVFSVDGGTRQYKQVAALEYPESSVYSVDDGTYFYVHPHAVGTKRIEAPGRVLKSYRMQGPTTARVEIARHSRPLKHFR